MKKLKLKKKEKKTNDKPKKIKNKSSRKNIVLITLFSLGIIGASCILGFALYIIITSPDFEVQKLYTKEASVIYDRNGVEIARVGSKNVDPVTYDDLPQVLIDALIATEDSRFFQHNGFDAARFFKASLGQLAGNSGAGGASTLSMQIVKNTFNGTESAGIAGIVRKFKDIYMSVFKLEAVYTKEEIIAFYLNSQWLSGGAINYESINGVEQGSQYYFGKSVSDLTLAEASLLVGMFNNPVLYNPYKNPNNSSNRRSTVLALMVRHGYITEEEKKMAEAIPVQSLLADHSNENTSEYQAFIDYVIDEVYQDTGNYVMQTPMAIYTTLDTSIQDVVHALEVGGICKWTNNLSDSCSNGNKFNWDNDRVQFGMAITSVEDGSILAMSGGRNYAAKGLNRATVTRAPGSTAKPIFDYGPYIEYVNHSTATPFIDENWSWTTGGSIRNYDSRYIGMTNMRYALVDSRNIPAVQAYQRTASAVGSEKIADFAHSLGINFKELFEAYSIGGGVEISPLQNSAAYATFGRGGYYIEPYSYTKIVYLENEKTIENKYTKTQVMSEETAYMITDMLVSAGRDHVGGNINISNNIAAKSGTTTVDGAAARSLGIPTNTTPEHWMVTYSNNYAIAMVYAYDKLGKNNNNVKQSVGYLTTGTGYNQRKNMMASVANKVFKRDSNFERPSTVKSVTIETGTYPVQLASEFTPDNLKATELFASGYEPTEVSTRFSKLNDATNGNATFDGKTIHLTWDPIATPDAINPEYLATYFTEDIYGRYVEKYINNRINYNTTNIGDLGYLISVTDANGQTTELAFVTDNNYTYTPPTTGNYTFTIKSAYSIFRDNKSDGLIIKAQANIDSNIEDIVNPTDPSDKPDDNKPQGGEDTGLE